MNALKPCPCCEGRAFLTKGYTSSDEWPSGTFHRVFCGSCQLRQLFHKTPEDAAEAWNHRPIAKAVTFDEYAEINQGRRGPPHPPQEPDVKAKQVVPVEPTAEMLSRAMQFDVFVNRRPYGEDLAREIYKAMLSVAPQEQASVDTSQIVKHVAVLNDSDQLRLEWCVEMLRSIRTSAEKSQLYSDTLMVIAAIKRVLQPSIYEPPVTKCEMCGGSGEPNTACCPKCKVTKTRNNNEH